MSSKGKIRRKRHLKQRLRRVGACLVCAPLLSYEVGDQPARLCGVWTCPSCKRRVALDFGDASERGRAGMRTLAQCNAYYQKVPMDGFTLFFNGQQVYDEPACSCGPVDCAHTQLLLYVETKDGETPVRERPAPPDVHFDEIIHV